MDAYYRIQVRFTDKTFVAKFISLIADLTNLIRVSDYDAIVQKVENEIRFSRIAGPEMAYRYMDKNYKVKVSKGRLQYNLKYEPMDSVGIICKYNGYGCRIASREDTYGSSSDDRVLQYLVKTIQKEDVEGKIAVMIAPNLGINYLDILRKINLYKESYKLQWVVLYNTMEIPLESIFSNENIVLISIKQIEDVKEPPLDVTVV